jgi:hypothetical protein
MENIMARYLMEYGKSRLFTLHLYAEEFVGASL